MAVISGYFSKQILDWTLNETNGLQAYAIGHDWPYRVPVPKPDPILEMQVGPAEAAVVGAAVLLGKNPSVSRRFWRKS